MTKTQLCLAASGLLLFAFVVNYILYAATIAYDVPEGDHWRWLRNGLIPLLQGRINFWQYLTVEFVPLSHSHILTLFEVWLSYHLFGLDYRLESWLGLFSMLAAFAVLCRQYWRMPGDGVPPAVKGVLVVCFAMVLLNQRNINAWTLVQFENLYLLGAIIYLKLADDYLTGKAKRASILPATFLVFFLGDAVGVAAILAVMVYMAVLTPRRDYQLLLQMIALVVACTLLSMLLIRGINPLARLGGNGNSGPGIVTYVFANALDFIKTVLMLLAHALGGPQEFRFYGGDTWLLARYITGMGVGAFLAVAALGYMHYRERLVATALPMLLILLCLASLAGIIITRFEAFGTDIANANRYVRLFQVGLAGAIWINSALLIKIYRQSRFRPLAWIAAGACGIILVVTFLVETHFYWRIHDFIVMDRVDMAAAFRQYAADDTFAVGEYHARCANHYCKNAIAFLEDNQLSLFRE